MKENFGATDDEWKVLQPKIEKVMTLRMQAGGMGGMMMGGGGRGRRGGGDGNGGGGAGATNDAAAAASSSANPARRPDLCRGSTTRAAPST